MADLLTREITAPVTFPLTQAVTSVWLGGSSGGGSTPDEYVANMNFGESRNLFYFAATH